MSAPTPMPRWACIVSSIVLALTALMGLVWGWLPSSDVALGPVTTADRATSAGACVATVAVLLTVLHLIDRFHAPRALRLTTTLCAVAFTVLGASTALSLRGADISATYEPALYGVMGVLLTPWAISAVVTTAFLAVSARVKDAPAALAETPDVIADEQLAEVVPIRRRVPVGTGTA